jgi:CrcB protein
MSPFQQSLLVFLGAGAGANARYWLAVWLGSKSQSFPWATLAVNLTGSLLLGVLMGVLARQNETMAWRLLLGVGVLGGYTTFSTFSMEAFQMLKSGTGAGILYILLSTAAGIALAALGYSLTHRS